MKTHRFLLTLVSCLLLSVAMFAESDLPVIEKRADRTII